jgi:hypothetical protein
VKTRWAVAGLSLLPVALFLAAYGPRIKRKYESAAIEHLSVDSNPPGKLVGLVIALPPHYWPMRGRHDWVFWAHGAGDSADGIFSPRNRPIADALLQAGFIIVATDYSERDCWGSPSCVRDVSTAISTARERFPLDGDPHVYTGSMGGFVILNSIAHGVIHPRAIYAAFPGYDLGSMYQDGRGYFARSIENAFGFHNPAQFEVATGGYNPKDGDPSLFRSIPFEISCSPADTAVNCERNGKALTTAVRAVGGTAQFDPCSGEHGDTSCMVPSKVVDFFKQH